MKSDRGLAEFEVTTFRAFIQEHAEQFISAGEVPGGVLGTVPSSEAERLGAEAA
jgi:hypothetical protein